MQKPNEASITINELFPNVTYGSLRSDIIVSLPSQVSYLFLMIFHHRNFVIHPLTQHQHNIQGNSTFQSSLHDPPQLQTLMKTYLKYFGLEWQISDGLQIL